MEKFYLRIWHPLGFGNARRYHTFILQRTLYVSSIGRTSTRFLMRDHESPLQTILSNADVHAFAVEYSMQLISHIKTLNVQ